MPKSRDGRERLRRAFGDVIPMKIRPEVAQEVCADFAPVKGQITAARAIAMAQVSKALRGDSKAYELIRGSLEPEEEAGDEPFRLDVSVGGE